VPGGEFLVMATDPDRRRSFDTATAVVEGAADGLADGIGEHGLDRSIPDLVRGNAPIAQRGIRSERLRATLDKADQKVSQAIDSSRTKARAIAESARRARRAPANVWTDLKDAGQAYVGGMAASLGAYAIAGFVGVIALILLTVGAVQGLNNLWGDPWGTFAVALLYGIIALAFVASAKNRAKAGKQRARLRMVQARLEMQRVADPVRQAFGSGAPTSTFGQLKDSTKLAPATASPTSTPQSNPPAPPLASDTSSSIETFPGREP